MTEKKEKTEEEIKEDLLKLYKEGKLAEMEPEEEPVRLPRRVQHGMFPVSDAEAMLSGLEQMFEETMYRPWSSFGTLMSRSLPAMRGEYGVDVKDHGDEILVVADMPGMEKGKVGIEVVNPRLLRIFAEREDEEKEEAEGYYRRERTFGAIDRMVPLPAEVNPDDATATLNNGVLEIHLKKIAKEPKKRIEIT